MRSNDIFINEETYNEEYILANDRTSINVNGAILSVLFITAKQSGWSGGASLFDANGQILNLPSNNTIHISDDEATRLGMTLKKTMINNSDLNPPKESLATDIFNFFTEGGFNIRVKYPDKDVIEKLDYFAFFDKPTDDGIDCELKRKINLCIDNVFEFAMSECNNLIDTIETVPKIKVSSKQRLEAYAEYSSLCIGCLYLFLTAPINKSIIDDQSADNLYKCFTQKILHSLYTSKGNKIESNNIVEYAASNYKYDMKSIMSINCGKCFASNLINIYNINANDLMITSAIDTSAHETIVAAMHFYKIIFND